MHGECNQPAALTQCYSPFAPYGIRRSDCTRSNAHERRPPGVGQGTGRRSRKIIPVKFRCTGRRIQSALWVQVRIYVKRKHHNVRPGTKIQKYRGELLCDHSLLSGQCYCPLASPSPQPTQRVAKLLVTKLKRATLPRPAVLWSTQNTVGAGNVQRERLMLRQGRIWGPAFRTAESCSHRRTSSRGASVRCRGFFPSPESRVFATHYRRMLHECSEG
jgi:hypothetical protein